jgi:diguanylate cyclase (GGDEF)-like protein
MSKAMMSSLRSFDVLGRWGPEEFAALVVNVDESRLNAVAERFLSLADKMDLSADGEKVRVAVSIGATLSRPGDTVDAILSRADMLRYNSKSAGGSRVTIDAAV